MLPASIELLLGSESVESLRRGSGSGLASLESPSNDGVYGRLREGEWVDDVMLSHCTPQLIASIFAPSTPLDVDLLARLELLRSSSASVYSNRRSSSADWEA
jgi:hypothetical protein